MVLSFEKEWDTIPESIAIYIAKKGCRCLWYAIHWKHPHCDEYDFNLVSDRLCTDTCESETLWAIEDIGEATRFRYRPRG